MKPVRIEGLDVARVRTPVKNRGDTGTGLEKKGDLLGNSEGCRRLLRRWGWAMGIGLVSWGRSPGERNPTVSFPWTLFFPGKTEWGATVWQGRCKRRNHGGRPMGRDVMPPSPGNPA